MRLKKLRYLILISGMAFFIGACNLEYFDNAEFQDFTWDPTLAIPVGEISYTVSDLFQELNDPNAVIARNSENVVTLLFVEELSSQDASGFLAVQEQGFNGALTAGINSPNSPIATTINVNENFIYDMTLNGSEQLDSIFFSSGTFSVDLSSSIQSDVNFSLTIHSLKERTTGDPLVVAGSLTQGSPVFNSVSNLVDYMGDFTDDGQGGTTVSQVLVDLEYSIDVEVGDNLTASDGLDFSITFSNPDYEVIYGNVGEELLDVTSQTIEMDFFSSFEDGEIRFADPRFTFTFDNSFGFPIGIDFQNVSARNSAGEVVTLSGSVTDNVQVVNAPLVENRGTSEKTTISLNVGNSNINELVSHKPIDMIFDVAAQTNPSSIPAQYNFLDQNSFLDVDIEVEIPLHIGIVDLTVEESMNFDNGADLDQVKSMMLRLIVDNGIPMGGSVEMVFRNGNTPVHTITDRSLFDAAPVGGDGRVTSSVQTITDVTLDEAAIRAMEDATNILVRATVTTTDAQSGTDVKLFADYEMNIRVAMQAGLAIDSNGN